jgi:hypothetical protein
MTCYLYPARLMQDGYVQIVDLVTDTVTVQGPIEVGCNPTTDVIPMRDGAEIVAFDYLLDWQGQSPQPCALIGRFDYWPDGAGGYRSPGLGDADCDGHLSRIVVQSDASPETGTFMTLRLGYDSSSYDRPLVTYTNLFVDGRPVDITQVVVR